MYVGHAEEYLPEPLESLSYLVRLPAKEAGGRQPMPHASDGKMLNYIVWVAQHPLPISRKAEGESSLSGS